MHRRAFEYFGGVPHTILYDNLKSVVLPHVGSTVQFNQQFLVFADQYLFEPRAATPRCPHPRQPTQLGNQLLQPMQFDAPLAQAPLVLPKAARRIPKRAQSLPDIP